MRIGICSGYFQRFHIGHRKYILDAKAACDMVVVIINNQDQQKRKYKGFKNLKTYNQIAAEIRTLDVLTTEAIDKDGSVCETLAALRKKHPDDELLFCKDADRNINNIPERETLERENIKLLQFFNPKENSSTDIMRKEAK